MTTPGNNQINNAFKELTRDVSAEADVEKATNMLIVGISEQLHRLRVNSQYDPLTIDAFVEQLRTHAPMWAQAVTVVGPADRAPAGSTR